MRKANTIGLVAMAMICGVSTSALAQADAVNGTPSADTATDADQGLGEIVVTAQRRQERLQDVPLAVQAVSSDQLASKGIGNIQELGSVVPSLSVSSAVGFGFTYLRGVGSTAIGPGIEVPVSIYVDGIYYASSTSSLFDFNNIDHVEVLKGPQGTLFGRNATGGLIQVITKDPTQDFHLKVGAGIDNYATAKGEFYIAGGIAEGVAADLSVSGTAQGDGWGTNIFSGKDVNRTIHNISLRSKWVFDLDDATKATVIGDYTNQKNSFNGQRIFPGTIAPTFLNYTSNPGRPWDLDNDVDPRLRNINWGASLKLVHDFDGVTLTNTTAYRRARTFLNWDIDFTPVPHLEGDLRELERQFSNELQLSSSGSGPLKWTAGVFYFRARGIYDAATAYSRDVPNNLFGPFEAVIPYGNQLTESVSGYAQGTYEIVPDTNLTLGARYTYEKRSITGRTEGLPFGATTPVLLGVTTPASITFKKPTFRVALDHRFSPEVLAYVSFNTGFKSGGFNTQFTSDPSFQPETIKAYEAGVKTDLLDRRLRLNLSSYYYDYKNIQVQKVGVAATGIINGASAEIYGAELELDALVTDAFRINGGAAYTHATFTDFRNAPFTTPVGGQGVFPGDASGNNVPKAPRFQGNIAGTYTAELNGGSKAEFTLATIYSGRYYFEANNVVSQKAFAKLNASIKWTAANDRYSVRIFGNNLTNRATAVYSSTLSDGTIDITYDAPRIYGVKLEYKF
ncbi:MAG: TonB-dependent receptor [Sphingobium sp.]|nr:TonB-dependent receptor [Sphingobium sp.]